MRSHAFRKEGRKEGRERQVVKGMGQAQGEEQEQEQGQEAMVGRDGPLEAGSMQGKRRACRDCLWRWAQVQHDL